MTPRAGGEAVDCTQGCTALEGDTATLSVSVGPVPNVFGESVESATAILADKDLSVTGTFEEFRDDLEAGLVVYAAQPDGDASLRPGDSVMLAVSKGPEPIAVPDVVGMSVGDAAGELRAAGFEVTVPGLLELFWDIYRVTKTDPAAGVLLAPGSTVTVTGSRAVDASATCCSSPAGSERQRLSSSSATRKASSRLCMWFRRGSQRLS